MKETKKRNHVIILAAVMVLALTGCGKKPTPVVEESKPSTSTVVVEETVKPSEEVRASSEPASEPSIEATTETTTETIVYEGIDLQSTLPGEEWLDTFEGVIDEPKIVVYNDSTNKKVIVENGGEVQFAADDTLVIYRSGAKIKNHDELKFTSVENGKTAMYSGLPRKYSDSGDTFEFAPTLEFNGEEIVYKITVNVE